MSATDSTTSFAQRVENRAPSISAMTPQKLLQTASMGRSLPQGSWAKGQEQERLIRLCRATIPVLEEMALCPDKALRLGQAGGRKWQRLRLDDLADLPRLLAGEQELCPQELMALELLDLSQLEIEEWQGALAKPQELRLVLLAGPNQTPHLAVDFDQNKYKPSHVAEILEQIAQALDSGAGS